MTKRFQNTLYTNDNLFVLCGMNSETVDLIYLDPPFNSKRIYSAPVGSKAAGASFKDMWTWHDVDEHYLDTLATKYPALTKYIAATGEIHSKAMMAYLTYMAQRIVEMHRLLKNTGSLYLHCDPTASHYLKVLLDEIFGKANFVNEIVWSYQGTANPAKSFKRKHDIILFYVKDKNDYYFDRDNSNEEISAFSKTKFTQKDSQGYYKEIKHSDGSIHRQYMRDKMRMRDVWEIPVINAMAKERTGYPTQKPLVLLQRIVKASSSIGDIILDPFCGCATTCVAAQQLDRKWIGIDIAKQSVGILVKRLSDDAGHLFKDFINVVTPPQRTDLKIEKTTATVKERLYREQSEKCNSCGEHFQLWNLEIDHIIPSARGGGDYYENYQLLCGACNRIKGDRPMEYLRQKIATREAMMKNKIVFGE